MVAFGKIFAVLIIIGLFLSASKKLFLIIVGVIVLLWIIRMLADLFWWGKDNKKW